MGIDRNCCDVAGNRLGRRRGTPCTGGRRRRSAGLAALVSCGGGSRVSPGDGPVLRSRVSPEEIHRAVQFHTKNHHHHTLTFLSHGFIFTKGLRMLLARLTDCYPELDSDMDLDWTQVVVVKTKSFADSSHESH
ncbi:hypothetical protein Droror1_Dr00003330 [Drosera rotundifolia]